MFPKGAVSFKSRLPKTVRDLLTVVKRPKNKTVQRAAGWKRKGGRKERERTEKNAKTSTNFQKVNKHHEFWSTKMGADSTQLQFQRYMCCVIHNKYHTITISKVFVLCDS